MSSARLAVVLWIALVVAGFAQMTVSIVTREPVNQHGFVSGVLVSCTLITAGWLAAGLVAVIADRKLSWSLALAVLLSVWLIGGPSLVLWGPATLDGVPFGAVLALAALGASALTMVAPVVTVAMSGRMAAIVGYILDERLADAAISDLVVALRWVAADELGIAPGCAPMAHCH